MLGWAGLGDAVLEVSRDGDDELFQPLLLLQGKPTVLFYLLSLLALLEPLLIFPDQLLGVVIHGEVVRSQAGILERAGDLHELLLRIH